MSDFSPSVGTNKPYIGGQAVLEGVMMRAPSSFAVVVRRRDRSLSVRERAMNPERKGHMPRFDDKLEPEDINLLAVWIRTKARAGKP